MSICSMVVYAKPENAGTVEKAIKALEGVEVHGGTETGKLVITIDHPDRMKCSETMMGLHDVPGVINTALIYEYYE